MKKHTLKNLFTRISKGVFSSQERDAQLIISGWQSTLHMRNADI